MTTFPSPCGSSTRRAETGDRRNCDYWVPITSTHCNYGGVRFWFLCPGWKNGVRCGRRCRKLYLRGITFACRLCHGLTYESTQKSGSLFYDLIERPFRIRDRTAPGLRNLRVGRKRDRALRRMDWAGRAIKSGFQRIPANTRCRGNPRTPMGMGEGSLQTVRKGKTRLLFAINRALLICTRISQPAAEEPE
jgi:hypothetical protein